MAGLNTRDTWADQPEANLGERLIARNKELEDERRARELANQEREEARVEAIRALIASEAVRHAKEILGIQTNEADWAYYSATFVNLPLPHPAKGSLRFETGTNRLYHINVWSNALPVNSFDELARRAR